MRLFVAKLLESILVFSMRPKAIQVEAPAVAAQITCIIVVGWQRKPRQFPGKSTGESARVYECNRLTGCRTDAEATCMIANSSGE